MKEEHQVFAERYAQGLILSKSSLCHKNIDDKITNQVFHSERFNLNSLSNIPLIQFERKCTIQKRTSFPRLIERKLFIRKSYLFESKNLQKYETYKSL